MNYRFTRTRRLALARLLATVAVPALFAGATAAETFPSKPIKLVVPYAPGGANDILGRAVAQKMGESLKSPVVVDNRAGAGGAVGTTMVSKSPADGYTLLVINTLPHTATASLYKKAPYDPVKDFTPISQIATTPYVLAVGTQSKVTTAQALLDAARAQPGKLNFASGGQGGATHLVMELFKSDAKVDLTHVAYKGGGPALTDLMGGQVDTTFENIVAVLPLVTGGKLRPLAVTSAQPSPQFPGVPTVASVLRNNFDVQGRFAIVGPSGLPADVVQKLNAAVAAAVKAPDVVNALAKLGITPQASTPEQLLAVLEAERTRWAHIINEKGIALE